MDHSSPHSSLLAAIVVWIEQRLQSRCRPVFLPTTFFPVFYRANGGSVMAHVRRRRLAKSAQRLVEEPDLKVVDLTFDSGFESQEAFTRAFKCMFGVEPGRFRQGLAITRWKNNIR